MRFKQATGLNCYDPFEQFDQAPSACFSARSGARRFRHRSSSLSCLKRQAGSLSHTSIPLVQYFSFNISHNDDTPPIPARTHCRRFKLAGFDCRIGESTQRRVHLCRRHEWIWALERIRSAQDAVFRQATPRSGCLYKLVLQRAGMHAIAGFFLKRKASPQHRAV